MGNNKPIRIAQMMTEMNYGGVEMVVMNYYRHIDKTKYQFDFFVLEGSEVPQRKEIESLGGRVFVVPHYKNLIAYENALIDHFKREKYQIVHSHMNTLSVFSLRVAKKAGVPNRIVHNHSTAGKGEYKKNIAKYLLRPFAKIYPTHLCACSKYAGEWIYGKNSKFRVFNNAIDLDKFKFDPNTRDKIRKQYKLKGKYVIGHIGRFCYQKNHEFLVDVFYNLLKIIPNALLLLIGKGENEESIKNKVNSLGIDSKVLFLGKRIDAYKFYQAMDVFVLPSRYEGLPVVGVEAQAAGLPCVLSTDITKETKILDSTTMIERSLGEKEWAEVIAGFCNHRRIDTSDEIRKAGFCLEAEATKLMEFYEKLINN